MSEQEIVKELTFITPAFLAGANQNIPEIRVPSIRGALRWWFRVLAGGRDVRKEEDELFGTVHGTVRASAISVRVEDANIVNNQQALSLPNETPMGYIGYFARAKGRTKRECYIDAKSTFTLKIREMRPVPADLWTQLEDAVQAFVWVGALGLRATRGFGRLAEQDNPPTAKAFREWAKTLRSRKIFIYEGKPGNGNVQAFLAEQLKKLRDDYDLHPGDPAARALGASTKIKGPERQASALRLCPVKTADKGILPFFLYTDNASKATSLQETVNAFCLESPCFTAL